MTTETVGTIEEQWAEVLGELEMQMTRATFDTWLRGTQVLGAEGQSVIIAVRHEYALDWLQHRFLPSIMPTVQRHMPGAEIKFVPVAPYPSAASTEDAAEAIQEQPIMEAVQEEIVQIGGPSGTLTWTDFYIKLKVAFRREALAKLKGAKLSCFLCLALHVDRDGVAKPGIETIIRETGYSRPSVCGALDELEALGLIQKSRSKYMAVDEYAVTGYAWFGKKPAPALWEAKK